MFLQYQAYPAYVVTYENTNDSMVHFGLSRTAVSTYVHVRPYTLPVNDSSYFHTHVTADASKMGAQGFERTKMDKILT